MKRLIMLFLILALVPAFPGLAEENAETVLTADNCEALAAVLQVKDPYADSVKQFAQDYAGQTIAFDANIAYVANHGSYDTRWDILIHAGDYSEDSSSGPEFQFSDVGFRDMGITGELFLPSFVSAGTNVSVTAKVGSYQEMSGLFELDPVLLKERAPGESASEAAEEGDGDTQYEPLEKGSKGEAVKALQERLIELYYLDGKADGQYGKNTQAAVEKFQEAHELEVTGKADSETQAKLFSDSAQEA